MRPRTGLSDNPVGFDRAVTTPLTGGQLHVIVDHGSVEIFIDGGATVLTQLCPPALLATPWALRVSGDPAQVHIRARRTRLIHGPNATLRRVTARPSGAVGVAGTAATTPPWAPS